MMRISPASTTAGLAGEQAAPLDSVAAPAPADLYAIATGDYARVNTPLACAATVSVLPAVAVTSAGVLSSRQ